MKYRGRKKNHTAFWLVDTKVRSLDIYETYRWRLRWCDSKGNWFYRNLDWADEDPDYKPCWFNELSKTPYKDMCKYDLRGDMDALRHEAIFLGYVKDTE